MTEPKNVYGPAQIPHVEEALRAQRESWREIAERTAAIPNRDLPPEQPRRILLFGLGSSHFAARLTAYAVTRDRNHVRRHVEACSSMNVGNEVVPQKGDWAFAFSHRGATKETLRALEACDSAGAFTVLVAGQGAPEPTSARHVLTTTALETCETHTKSVTGAICAVSTLLLGPKGVEEWDALRSIGDPNLDVMRGRASNGPAAILGEWEGEWLAREAALKLMELACVPARAFSSEEFFHGPHASVPAGAPVWHVSVARDGRGGEIADALKPTVTVGIFGSSPLAWVPALVELQWLALAVAMNSKNSS